MHIPNGWATPPAGGYGGFTRLTHERCGDSITVDLVLDERRGRQFIANHECDDLRAEREEREKREADQAKANQTTVQELAGLRARVDDLAARLNQVDAPTPTRLIVLDATTEHTLAATVDHLAEADYLALATAIENKHIRDTRRVVLREIREALESEVVDAPTPVGVLFTAATDRPNPDFLGETATVVYPDGGTVPLRMPHVAETLMELYYNVGPDASLAIDLTTNTFDYTTTTGDRTISDRFNVPAADDTHVVTAVRSALERATSDLGREPLGAVFRPNRADQRGFYLTGECDAVFANGNRIRYNLGPEVQSALRARWPVVTDDFQAAVDIYAGTVTTGRDAVDTLVPDWTRDRRILGHVRDTIADANEDGEDGPINEDDVAGVQFKARVEADGYYLSSDDGLIVFRDGSTTIGTFPGIAALFSETIGCVGEHYTVSVHLRTSTVTHTENDWVPVENRFNVPPA